MFKRVVSYGSAALGIPLALLAALTPKSIFYRDRRPTRFGKFTNDVMARWYSTRTTPAVMSTLEVRRRRSGGVQRVPIVVADYEGAQYLVSMLGPGSEWSKNVVAAHGEAVIVHGAARPVRLEPVPVEERAPIIKAYVKRAIGARHHVGVPINAPIEEFERVAAEYPVYRLTSLAPVPA